MSIIPGFKFVGGQRMSTPRYRWDEQHKQRVVAATVIGDVGVYIDVERLLKDRGYAALLNKNGKAVLGRGAIQLVCTGRHEKEEA
jgi:hypothetical protein